MVFFGVAGVILESAFEEALGSSLREFAVLIKLGFKLGVVDGLTFFEEEFLSNLERKAVSLEEIKSGFTIDLVDLFDFSETRAESFFKLSELFFDGDLDRRAISMFEIISGFVSLDDRIDQGKQTQH